MDFKELIKDVRSSCNMERVKNDAESYVIYNGQLRQKIIEIIQKEFSSPKTIKELTNRIVPINITQKIINALGKVYKNGAERSPVVNDDADQELIDMYSRSFDSNYEMDFSNKMVKNTKHCLVKPYLDSEFIPRIRIMPSHTFTVYGTDPINPERPTQVIEHIKTSGYNPKEMRFSYWDKDNHFILDGEGTVMRSEMAAMKNEDGVNPYGVLPHTHITSQKELLYPIQSNDIKSVTIASSLLLSDSTLAQKYLSWGTLTVIGGEGEEKLEVGPAATIQVPIAADGTKPEIKYLQPELNSDEVLNLVEKLIEYVLTTNSLSAGTVIGKMSSSSSESGVSKLLDTIESTENIEEQQKIYRDAEKRMWHNFANYMLPVWVKSGEINKDYVGTFSKDFELAVKYPTPKIQISEKERIENVRAKLDAGLITMARALREVHPEMEDDEIDQLQMDIQKEKVESTNFFQRNINGVESQEAEV